MHDVFILMQAQGGNFYLPPQASSVSGAVDFGINLLLVISAIFFALIVGLMVFFVWKYRRKEGDYPDPHAVHHHTGLELVWSIIPSILLVVIFGVTYDGYSKIHTVPEKAMEIKVSARQFDWQFEYEGGTVSKTLKVPVGQKIKLVMRSSDVLHALFIPAFRIKHDVVPGRFHELSFEATVEGTYILYCAEYCGASHSKMITQVEVMSAVAFDKWKNADRFDVAKLSEQQWKDYRKGKTGSLKKKWPTMKIPTLAQYGRTMFDRHGCGTCHTTTAQKMVGPGLAGLWGKKQKLVDGREVTIDEPYLIRSIKDPSADIPAGYPKPSQMEAILARPDKVTPRQTIAIIEYIKTLKK